VLESRRYNRLRASSRPDNTRGGHPHRTQHQISASRKPRVSSGKRRRLGCRRLVENVAGAKESHIFPNRNFSRRGANFSWFHRMTGNAQVRVQKQAARKQCGLGGQNALGMRLVIRAGISLRLVQSPLAPKINDRVGLKTSPVSWAVAEGETSV